MRIWSVFSFSRASLFLLFEVTYSLVQISFCRWRHPLSALCNTDASIHRCLSILKKKIDPCTRLMLRNNVSRCDIGIIICTTPIILIFYFSCQSEYISYIRFTPALSCAAPTVETLINRTTLWLFAMSVVIAFSTLSGIFASTWLWGHIAVIFTTLGSCLIWDKPVRKK